MIVFSAAVEGEVDEALVRRVMRAAGVGLSRVYGRQGKDHLDRRLSGYNRAARHQPWIVVRDLDKDAECAPSLVSNLLPDPSHQMCFRVAVRSAESWILADRERASRFLGVPLTRIPENPDRMPDPKSQLIQLARKSRFGHIVEDLVPGPGSSARVGPLYTARMIEFISTKWRPEEAARASDSLARYMAAVRRMVLRGSRGRG